MGTRDRDWWKEKYDELNGRGAPKRPGFAPRSDRGVLRLATVVLLLVVVVVLCLHKAHVL